MPRTGPAGLSCVSSPRWTIDLVFQDCQVVPASLRLARAAPVLSVTKGGGPACSPPAFGIVLRALNTDEELMAAYVAGNAQAFRELFERLAPGLERYLLRDLAQRE